MQPRLNLDEQKTKWKKKMMEKSGTFLAVCVFNSVILLLLSSVVIYHFIVPHEEDVMVFSKVKLKVVPPPPKPVSKGGEAQKALADPTDVVVPPPVSQMSLVTTTNPATFSFQSTEVSMPNTLPSFTMPTGGGGLSQGTSGGGVPQANPFGGSLTDGGAPALVGYFYDLKQTSDNPPQPTDIKQKGWKEEMLKLVANNLHEDNLSKFLKSPEPRTSNGLSIAEQSSENAPSAFGLGDKVKPSLWAIVYHCKAVAPETGRFRFVGFGDDMLVVFKDGEMVMDAGWQHMSERKDLHETYPNVWSVDGAATNLRKGSWFNVEQGQTISLDVAIGDWGGKCGYFLLLEKDGVQYEMTADGTPKLPLFQVGAKLPVPSGPETPPASDSTSVWTSADQ